MEMDAQAIKIQRNNQLLTLLMLVALTIPVIEFYQTNTIDLKRIAQTIGMMALLRGLMLTPWVLHTPIKQWFDPNNKLTKQSYKHFACAVILFFIGSFSVF